MPLRRALPLAAALVAAAPAAAVAAQPFAAPTPVGGFEARPPLALLSDLAVGADGRTVLAGTRDVGDRRQVVAGTAAPGALVTRVGALRPTADITDQPEVAVGDDGTAAIVWSEGHTAWLSLCRDGVCATPVVVGRSALKPQPAVAVQPVSGRVTVLWRGRTPSGANRLQWRVTTGGKLGRTHTLGELGDTPQLAVDASGKAVALWTRYVRTAGSPRGLRTAARRVGEFTRPATLAEGDVTQPQLTAGTAGLVVAAWVDRAGRVARAATRTRDTAFTPAQDVLGGVRTIDLAGSPTGKVALALVTGDTPQAAVPHGTVLEAPPAGEGDLPAYRFRTPQALAAPEFVSDAAPARAAMTQAGTATVAWASGTRIAAASAAPGAPFGAAQAIAPNSAVLVSQVVLAGGPGGTQLAFASAPSGPQVTRALEG